MIEAWALTPSAQHSRTDWTAVMPVCLLVAPALYASVLMAVVPITHMRMSMGNRVMQVRMGMPVGAIGAHVSPLFGGMLMGMVSVLITLGMQVLVLMPHLVMAVPVGMVLLEHQGDSTNHQNA